MIPNSPWAILSVSFVTALTGACMPGPLLSYTIARTIRTQKRGFLTGAWVVAGHASIEALILPALILGVAQILKTPIAIKIIGGLGMLFLGYMGIGLIGEAVRLKKAERAASGDGPQASAISRMSPVLAGALISMSSPYWWVWWITAGSAILTSFDVGPASWIGIAAFFIGHEAADLGWYVTVSTLTHLGRRWITGGFYRGLLMGCGFFIITFGVYLAIRAFLAGAQ